MQRSRRPGIALVAVALAATGCVRAPRGLAPPQPSRVFQLPQRPVCDGGYLAPEVAGAVGEDALVEASGIVASPTHPGVLWLHNDAGDDARLYAMSARGASLGALTLPGVTAVDFEDIAAAPCPDLAGACLYVGDTGDNDLERDELVVYAVAEPDVAPDRPLAQGATAERMWRFPVSAPDRANIEGFVVLPDVSAMVFFDKEAEDARILRLPAPWVPDFTATLEVSTRFDPPGVDGQDRVVTGADIHPTGTRLLVRTYDGAFEAALDPGAGKGAETVAASDFREVLVGLDEPQGEAIAYDEEGTGVWTVSESPDRVPNQPMHHASCDSGGAG